MNMLGLQQEFIGLGSPGLHFPLFCSNISCLLGNDYSLVVSNFVGTATEKDYPTLFVSKNWTQAPYQVN